MEPQKYLTIKREKKCFSSASSTNKARASSYLFSGNLHSSARTYRNSEINQKCYLI